MERVDPASLRRRIGMRLRHARTKAGLTTNEAAAELGCSRGKISQMEAGMYRFQHRDVRDLLKFYGVPQAERDPLVEKAKRSAEPSWWSPYSDVVEEWFAFFLGSEGEAIREFNYEQLVVPGLLQTRDYAAALAEASRSVAAEDHQEVANLRLERQRRLDDPDPLVLHVVLEESVLWRPIGGVGVLRAQLRRLIEMSALRHVEIQVMPTGVGAHSGMDGKFVLLEFAEFGPGVFLESHPVLGARYDLEDPKLIETYSSIAKALRDEALDQRQSVELMEHVIADLTQE
ncbi:MULTISPECIES: helix-turn-helix domain-containing protein [Actinopolyspora alba group]|uniref:helix-turn-helix domain-containing protein n=1 Tax=Actinopolyspora alba group TaxID=2893675 RepID=UPI0011139935|nr:MULTISPECIES: helix-turn-helix transcriptional regulator [Actinopolyspora alba group]